jgi:alpha-galactosidase
MNYIASRESIRRSHWMFRLIACFLVFCAIHGWAGAEDTAPPIQYNVQTHVFRIDGARVSYIFGVNEKGQLQSLYWGQRLDADDPFPSPTSLPGHTAFDPSINATPQEFVGWGGALYSVPDLKITFPDGNRDLVMRYASHTIQGDSLSIVLKDIGGASRLLHHFVITAILPHSPHPHLRPVLYNSWEATQFHVDEAGQETLAEKAASIGVERFVVDDGWFGERNSDHAGLGDWFVNSEKFPHGLEPLIDKVHSLGMDFGLWVEPEMVNPDSELYRKHPDWVLNFPARPRTEGRHQLVLNLARPDVRAYVYEFLDKLLTENDIAFLKWDYNRNWSEPGWPSVAPQEEKKIYVNYIENLYSILKELREHHPNVEIESCSGGGGRVDLGIMAYTDEVWPSDNTDPFDRLSIQNGFTYAYSPGVMMAWVTDSPSWMNSRSTSLEYRFLSAMQGSLGVGANLNKWATKDFATATKMVAQYKKIRQSIQRGSLYRLISPSNGSEFSATESVSTDLCQAVIFAFLHSSQMGYSFPRIYPRGLESNAVYSFQVLDGNAASGTPALASGAYWMQNGLDVSLRGDFQAAALLLEEVKPAQDDTHRFHNSNRTHEWSILIHDNPE